jgi:hypothetical protein
MSGFNWDIEETLSSDEKLFNDFCLRRGLGYIYRPLRFELDIFKKAWDQIIVDNVYGKLTHSERPDPYIIVDFTVNQLANACAVKTDGKYLIGINDGLRT